MANQTVYVYLEQLETAHYFWSAGSSTFFEISTARKTPAVVDILKI
jgi:hypothetical protein